MKLAPILSHDLLILKFAMTQPRTPNQLCIPAPVAARPSHVKRNQNAYKIDVSDDATMILRNRRS